MSFGDQIHRRELKITRHEGGIMGGSKRGTTGGGGCRTSLERPSSAPMSRDFAVVCTGGFSSPSLLGPVTSAL